ncbi:3-oxoadipate enol-lactonase 2 [Defluviimonas aquaemixtae]|uniref:3-oxoadipate enol-lactonase 2 n=1 Tax=Albidovulum aquaemixtae TaxID=1542388 RepID=A0A2R8BNY4_9RHOB|nr:alpha/beta fold hydrolase [Defluviimonas aquaemixtae]SPH25055.1 3-oxoadipate enol-lactonase 2 [Defluviimonas aquaemixtae]
MQFSKPRDVTLHYRFSPRLESVTPIAFLNSLGTDFRIWDGVVNRVNPDIPSLRMDKRGQELSDEGPISLDAHIVDVADLMDTLGLKSALICGIFVGGMIAQGLAAARPDLISGLMLCNTGARIDDAAGWNARIAAVGETGIASLAESILERWFSPDFHRDWPAEVVYRNILTRTPAGGYAGICAAIRDSDFVATSASLKLSTICVEGSDDLATPPATVRKLADLIQGADYNLLDGVGHLPCIEAPEMVARHLSVLHGRL